jgi:serpin B
MKPLQLLSIALSAMIFIAGCTKKSVNPIVTNQTDQQFSIAKSESVTRESPAASNENIAKQAESINKLAIAMYNQCKQDGKSLFLSPYSITSALAMTAAGADSNTKKQIRDALQVSLAGNDFDQAINSIDQSLMTHAAATDGITLNIVNSSWIQSGWDFKVSYLDHIAQYYGAGVNLLDFANKPEDSRVTINTWVADQTNDKIIDLIPQGAISPLTKLVLTNAIYFLGDWLYSFNPDYTVSKDFTLLDKSKASVPTMSLGKPDSLVKMLYARGKGVRALDFPYKGDRLAMTVLLPDLDSFSMVENSLSTTMLNQLLSSLSEKKLAVSLPKFKFTFGSFSLKDAFKALGMTDAFDPIKADFSRIDGTRSLFIGDIVHKAFIAVDEKGTEAAAATAVVFEISAVLDPVIFLVDRPFIFVIRDKQTGSILFIGRILNPLLTE